MDYLRKHGELFLLVLIVVTAVIWFLSTLFPADPAISVIKSPRKMLLILMGIIWIVGFAYCVFKSDFPFFRKHKETIGLTLLIAYVIVLALGTVSEIFDLGWFYWL